MQNYKSWYIFLLLQSRIIMYTFVSITSRFTLKVSRLSMCYAVLRQNKNKNKYFENISGKGKRYYIVKININLIVVSLVNSDEAQSYNFLILFFLASLA